MTITRLDLDIRHIRLVQLAKEMPVYQDSLDYPGLHAGRIKTGAGSVSDEFGMNEAKSSRILNESSDTCRSSLTLQALVLTNGRNFPSAPPHALGERGYK